MKKQLLLIATALLTLTGHARAEELNAVCVSLKSGQTEFVAFNKKPQIKADGGKLYVVSADDQSQLLLADLSQVEKITRLASEAPYEVWLSDDTVMLDARSLLGLFALVGKKARVVVADNVNPKAFGKLVDKMA